MTLLEWETQHNRFSTPIRDSRLNATIRYIPDFVYAGREELWNLSDYRVMSISGGAIWLAPKEPK